jgi:hypothetical protein
LKITTHRRLIQIQGAVAFQGFCQSNRHSFRGETQTLLRLGCNKKREFWGILAKNTTGLRTRVLSLPQHLLRQASAPCGLGKRSIASFLFMVQKSGHSARRGTICCPGAVVGRIKSSWLCHNLARAWMTEMKEYIVLQKEDRAHQLVHADSIAIHTETNAGDAPAGRR